MVASDCADHPRLVWMLYLDALFGNRLNLKYLSTSILWTPPPEVQLPPARGERVKEQIAVAAAAAAPLWFAAAAWWFAAAAVASWSVAAAAWWSLAWLSAQPHPSMRMPPRPASFRSPPLASSTAMGQLPKSLPTIYADL